MTTQGIDTSLDVRSCADEPIHIPGSIQPHGVLLALDPTTLVIEQVSENSGWLLGVLPRDLIGESPACFLGEAQFRELSASLGAQPFEAGVSTIVAGPHREAMECVTSRYRGSLILELQPLSGAESLDFLDVSLSLQAPLARMERASSVSDLVSIVAKEVRAISGFDRVLVYRFDEDWHGEVIAEDVGDRFRVAYLGLHFPASDIPAQARELYLLNTLRLIPDAEYAPVAIVPAENPRLHAPLDLSRSELRSVSPVHVEYLRNIGVRATLTMSIVVHGRLWGLVACHHASPRRVTHAVRSTCNFFAQMLALKVTARLDHAALAQRLNASKRIVRFVAELEATKSLWETLRRSWADLLQIFDAHALFVRGPEGISTYGTSLSAHELLPAIARLQQTATDGIAHASSLSTLDPEAKRFAQEASGALYVGLSREDDRCLVMLRREQRASVQWAGDPHKPASAGAGSVRLSPRASFAAWEEITQGESTRWTASDIEKAATLREQLLTWQAARDEVRLLAHYDPLTKLPNRRLLDELLSRSLSDADLGNRLVGVLFVDIDRFKRFNDRLGHAGGDRVLREVATRMSRTMRDGDIVGRLGGDEFVVIMPALADPAAAEAAAQRLLEEISQPMPGLEGHDLRVTLSIGISLYPSDGVTSETLLSKADAAMYRVKEHSGGAWQAYDDAPAGLPGDPSRRAKNVAEALARHEIVAHFQPVVDLADGRVVAVEALARWNHPVSGLLGPAAFIDAVKDTESIVRLGETMLDLSCRHVSRWRRTGTPNLRVAVNVSPRQLRDAGFVESVRTMLGRYQLPAEALDLEITEDFMAGDATPAIDALRELADRGVRIAIDHFGTGYSSFNYLRRLPVKSLKIDHSFVAELNAPETFDSGAAIIRAIVSVAKSLGLDVVAEGIETQAQLRLLRALGCDYAQGNFIGRALAASAYSSFSQVSSVA